MKRVRRESGKCGVEKIAGWTMERIWEGVRRKGGKWSLGEGARWVERM